MCPQDNPLYKKSFNLFFNKNRDEITDEQKEFVEKRLGLDSNLSVKELKKILWKAYFKKGFKLKNLLFEKTKYKNRRFIKILNFIKISYKKDSPNEL